MSLRPSFSTKAREQSRSEIHWPHQHSHLSELVPYHNPIVNIVFIGGVGEDLRGVEDDAVRASHLLENGEEDAHHDGWSGVGFERWAGSSPVVWGELDFQLRKSSWSALFREN